jgi:1-acyl-sn-glycerol-3-phosphate acyltransferase
VKLIAAIKRNLQTERRAPGWPALTMIFWWDGVRSLLWLLFKMAYRIRLEGSEHVPSTGPIIYVANHHAHFDPCLVGCVVHDRPFSGMARKTLFKNPIMSWIMRSIGVIPLDQTKGDTAAFKAGLEELKLGRCLLIFPEGTRTRNGAVGPFKPGAALLMKRSGATVVPLAIEGAYDIWPITGKPWPKLTGRIAVRAAPAMSSEEILKDGVEAGLNRLRTLIDDMRLELRARMRSESGGRYPAPSMGDAPPPAEAFCHRKAA